MESHQTHFQRAVCFFHQGQLPDALASLNQCLSMAPTLALAHNNIAVVYEHMGKSDEAEESLKNALALNPSNYLFYFNSSSICMRRGKSKQSLSLIQQAISAQLTVLGKLKKDPTMLERALEVCPNNIEASLLLSMHRVSSGQYL